MYKITLQYVLFSQEQKIILFSKVSEGLRSHSSPSVPHPLCYTYRLNIYYRHSQTCVSGHFNSATPFLKHPEVLTTKWQIIWLFKFFKQPSLWVTFDVFFAWLLYIGMTVYLCSKDKYITVKFGIVAPVYTNIILNKYKGRIPLENQSILRIKDWKFNTSLLSLI